MNRHNHFAGRKENIIIFAVYWVLNYMISIKRIIIFSMIPAAMVLIIILLTAFSIQGSYTEIYVQPRLQPIQEILTNSSNSYLLNPSMKQWERHPLGVDIDWKGAVYIDNDHNIQPILYDNSSIVCISF